MGPSIILIVIVVHFYYYFSPIKVFTDNPIIKLSGVARVFIGINFKMKRSNITLFEKDNMNMNV